MQTKSTKDKKGLNLIKVIFPILGLIGAINLGVLLYILLVSYSDKIGAQTPIIVITIGLYIFSYIFISYLDRNEKVEKIGFIIADLFKGQNKGSTREGINLKWIPILVLGFLPELILFIYYISSADLSQDILSTINLNFVVFFITSTLCFLGVITIYFSIKNFRSIKHTHKIKFPLFSAYAILMLILGSFGVSMAYNYLFNFPPAMILKGNGHTDGPWLNYFNDSPNSSIAISWTTKEYNSSIVYYGTDKYNLNLKATGEPGFVHHVYLNNLEPNTTYYYKIYEKFENEHILDNSENIFNFTTAASDASYFKFAFIGDMQPTDDLMIKHNKLVTKGLLNKDFKFICQLGDMADSGANLEDWHRLFESYSLIASHVPGVQTIGNHDWAGSGGSSNWGELFPQPYVNPKKGRYFSFNYHNVHIISLDNFERTYSMSEEQINWLINDLQKAQAEGKEWIFVMFHLTLITVSTSGHYYDLEKQLVPIFDKYGVDFVFFGHDHDYQHYNVTYGANGHLFNAEDTWTHHEIHYFCSGGGGANLETSYGVLTMNDREENFTFYDTNAHKYESFIYTKHSWNDSYYYEHPGFKDNYTMEEPVEGRYYYNTPKLEQSDPYAINEFGFNYAEETFHYIQIEINGSNCTISARYPNGQLISGPGGLYPQIFQFKK
ncbi:MAG: metallophosphoesterase [Promethearchaeota archaeon]